MKFDSRRIFTKAVAVTALFCMTTQTTFAALLDLAQEPLAISQVAPKIMLAVSKDQQLYKKAYNDYTDLDGDGTIETNYKHTIEYYGYFDSFKCYEYLNDRFEPKANSSTKLCNGSQWSGNFLNWVSMSRIDAVRKLLYGGLRSTDEMFDAKLRPAPVTVLERSYLPTDAHAWAKHYNPGADATVTPPINQLTPFSPPTTPVSQDVISNPAFNIPNVGGDLSITFAKAPTNVSVGDQVTIHQRGNINQRLTGVILAITNTNRTLTLRVDTAGLAGSGIHTNWTILNLSSAGISFCNLTTGSTSTLDPNHRSSTNTRPPLIRVAAGNFALWNANEIWQCQWFAERNNTQGITPGRVRSNGNRSIVSEIDASAENPSQTLHGLGKGFAQGEYIARVVVCDPKLFDPANNRENCKKYPSGNMKPIGLLQEYGDTGRFEFGLITGSYAKNISGGVLRKNAGPLSDEIRVDTDGTFREDNGGGTFRDPYRPRGGTRTQTAAQSPPGIINTLNYMRIYGYQYITGRYSGDPAGKPPVPNESADGCPVQLTSLTENSCTSWGNPMSEIYFEAVRYFAGQAASSAYTYTAGSSKDNELGLPLATAVDPLNKDNYCANLNVLVFNASVSDNDDDLRGVSAADIRATGTIGDLTDVVGAKGNENINGNRFFVGKIVGAKPDSGFELCTAKTIGLLSNVSGICPEGPTTGGSYLMAGIAHHAKTQRIRPDLSTNVPPASNAKAFKVSTFAVQLASNTPQLEIKGTGTQRVVIQPIYRLDLSGLGGGFGGGGLVDMRYVKINDTGNVRSGKVYVNWEDSEQGGDYDQDMWGTIEWSLNTNTNRITITTNAISASTRNPQGFGYSISGTTLDGPHFHSGILGFNYTDPLGVLGCTNCNLVGSGGQTGPQSITYDLGGGGAASKLQDPMWYAAKYGGFTDNDGSLTPNAIPEWDRENNATGVQTADGIPDNYFLVTNPLQLVVALRSALAKLDGDSSGTAVMANSTSLSTTSRIFQARYDPFDWSGQLLAKDVKPDGTISAIATWDAGKKLNLADKTKRVILTLDDMTTRDGVAFDPATISANLLLELNKSPVTGAADGLGADRLAWLRGDVSREVRNKGTFRDRKNSVLGDIAGSDPTYVASPNAPRTERDYGTFRRTFFNRTPMIYVGANDGMVHGFDATTGDEKIAYIPSKVHRHLAKLTAPTYAHRFYVDGPTEAADAVVNKAWRTVLVGGLGGGGQGVYALDVTDPSKFAAATASTHVLWEFNDTDDPDLGYVYGKPVVREMANGRWAAIVSGGYNNSEGDVASSKTGHAYLFILFLDGPTGANRKWVEGVDYIKIDTGVGTTATPNGLAPPFAADVDADGKTDFVYAGDLSGNFWKFDLRLADPKADPAPIWTGAANKALLFIATETGVSGSPTQPITAQAEGTGHPTRKGFVIVFGTGKYIETGDTIGVGKPPVYQPQSFYGIWDKNDPAPINAQPIVNKADLLDQPITESGTVRTVPLASPDWTKHSGWKMEFPNSVSTGERSVFRPILTSSRLIFTTLIPIGEPCLGGGTSFLMIVDPATGSRVDGPVLDVKADGILNDKDQVTPGVYASGLKSEVGIAPTPVVVKGGPNLKPTDNASKIFGTMQPAIAGAEGVLGFTFMGGPLGIQGLWIGLRSSAGRVSWREILTN